MYDDTKDTDPTKRTEEAWKLLQMIDRELLEPKELDFVSKLAENFKKYDKLTLVSKKQLYWLRDIKDKYL